MLGTVGLISSDEVKDPAYADYGVDDTVGKTGLEKTYERFLHGTPGTNKIVVDPAGTLLDELGGQLPVPGDDVKLYLNTKTQSIVERDLLAGIERARSLNDEDPTNAVANFVANAGAVVVMDPKTGGVEASASWPTYDPTQFVKGMTVKEYKQRFRNPSSGDPLFDRATQGVYAPGSTFKPFIALAALKNGVVSPGSATDCPAQWAYRLDPNHPFNNWSTYDQGFMTIPEALKVSCDTVFYQWGGGFYGRWRSNQLGAGSEPLQHDLGGSVSAASPASTSPASRPGSSPPRRGRSSNPSRTRRTSPTEWLPGDDILMAIGQGYVLTSPMQMATAYSAIANGGRLCEPHLAEQVQTSDGKRVHKIGSNCRDLPYTPAGDRPRPGRPAQVVAQGSGTASRRSPGSRSRDAGDGQDRDRRGQPVPATPRGSPPWRPPATST